MPARATPLRLPPDVPRCLGLHRKPPRRGDRPAGSSRQRPPCALLSGAQVVNSTLVLQRLCRLNAQRPSGRDDAREYAAQRGVLRRGPCQGAASRSRAPWHRGTGSRRSRPRIGWVCRGALELNDRAAVHWSPVISTALRVRGPVAAGISTGDPDERRSFLGRFDALRTIFEACHLPKAHALVHGAIRLTGFVLRDAGALHSWLHEATTMEDADYQTSLTVAMGFLGAAPAMDDGWPDPRDAGQAAAYLLAVSLGVDGPRRPIYGPVGRRAQSPNLHARGMRGPVERDRVE
jgi:hypothetical protein